MLIYESLTTLSDQNSFSRHIWVLFNSFIQKSTMSAINAIVKPPVIPFSKKKEEGELRKIKLEHTVTINVTIGMILTSY